MFKGKRGGMRTLLKAAVIACMVAVLAGLAGCSGPYSSSTGISSDFGSNAVSQQGSRSVSEGGNYTSKDEVALYIHTYGHLPGNFISKTKARDAGWVSAAGNLQKVCPGKSIGGSTFYNDDGKLPKKSGRTWKECDIDYHGGVRGAKRIVFSNDGLIYYTKDHYESFERLY